MINEVKFEIKYIVIKGVLCCFKCYGLLVVENLGNF